jgi:uncharacterized PurR-regulated membrane protein YhhQ (DUF165 family)
MLAKRMITLVLVLSVVVSVLMSINIQETSKAGDTLKIKASILVHRDNARLDALQLNINKILKG